MRSWIGGTALLLAALSVPAGARPIEKRGRLVVVLVIDQLRYADLLRVEPELGAGGFAGLGQPVPMRYDTVGTETGAGHATLSTGTFASVHGIVANNFYDGVLKTRRELAADPACTVWGHPDTYRGPAMLMVPTVAAQLKLATVGRGRVVAISGKDRAAIFLAGPTADLALWYDLDSGGFISSTCYGPSPPPWLARWNATRPSAAWRDKEWTPSFAAAILDRYGERTAPSPVPLPAHVGAQFPHRIGAGAENTDLYNAILRSPAGTTITLAATTTAIEAMQLGSGSSGDTDLLMVSISTIDYVGHAFGTLSWERYDALLKLHQELGAFVAELKRRLGGRVSFLLTSDHGATDLPAHAARFRAPSGALEWTVLTRAIDGELDRAYPGQRARGGAKSWVTWMSLPSVNLLQIEGIDPDAVAARAARVARAVPGVWRAVPAAEAERDPEAVVRHSFYPGRSGDLIVVARPGWMVRNDNEPAATTHRGPWNDEALVPWLVDDATYRLRPFPDGGVTRATQFAPSLSVLLGTAPPAAAFDDPALIHRERRRP